MHNGIRTLTDNKKRRYLKIAKGIGVAAIIIAVFLGVPVLFRSPVGMASFYHDSLAGQPTASGESYNPEALTAAHPDLPFGTLVRVTNLDNEKFIVVRINDRGPHVQNRIIDLSRRAAREIDMIQDGVVKVRLEVLDKMPDR